MREDAEWSIMKPKGFSFLIGVLVMVWGGHVYFGGARFRFRGFRGPFGDDPRRLTGVESRRGGGLFRFRAFFSRPGDQRSGEVGLADRPLCPAFLNSFAESKLV